MEQPYFAVRIDRKSWTKDAAPVSFWTSHGAHVQDSRLVGGKDIFIGGRLVAHLFASKFAAAAFVAMTEHAST